MKKALYTPLFLLIIIILFQSCATDRSVAQRIAEFENSKADEAVCFVQMNDGTIKYYTTLKLVTGVFTSPHLLADGQVKISASEIKAYQDANHYVISQKVFTSGKHSAVAVETLPGFAIRVVQGKLNVYCKKFFNGERAVDEYYLQSGDDGEILVYTPVLMNDMVKNDPAAFNFFNNKKIRNHMPEKLLATVKLFNNDQLISKN